MLYAFREREILMNLNELLAGFRFFPSYIRVGGLREDIPRGFKEAVKAFLDRFPGKLDEYETLITKNPIWLDRTRGVGVITLRGLLQVGPVRSDRARRRRRLRRAPRLPVHRLRHLRVRRHRRQSNGDVYDRYLTRVAEMRESVKICRQALERIDAGRRRGPVDDQRDRAAAQGPGLHRDGSADSALPDLLAGLQGAGRRRLRAGRRAARRARLLRRVRRHQPSVARAHALARTVWPARRCTSSSSAA